MKRRTFIAALASALAMPVVARAQQTMPVIGFLSSLGPADAQRILGAFHRGLAEAGYVEGRNVALEYRWGRRKAMRWCSVSTPLRT